MTLREWLELPGVREDWTILSVAAALGRDRVWGSRVVNGHVIPRPKDMLGIFVLTEGAVQPIDWYPDIRLEKLKMEKRAREERRERLARAPQPPPSPKQQQAQACG